MRIALLGDGYKKFMYEICARLNAEPVVLEWTQDIEKDLAQIREADPDVVLIHGHPSHHGFRLADAIIDTGLGVEVAIISSVSGFCKHSTLELALHGDIHGSDFMAGNAEAVRRGATLSGYLQWERWRLCEIERHHAEASKAIAEAGRIRLAMDAERKAFREHLDAVAKRKAARS